VKSVVTSSHKKKKIPYGLVRDTSTDPPPIKVYKLIQ